MKKIIILSLYIFPIAGLFTACSKDENGEIPDNLTQFPTPLVVKVAGDTAEMTCCDPATFTTNGSGNLVSSGIFPLISFLQAVNKAATEKRYKL